MTAPTPPTNGTRADEPTASRELEDIAAEMRKALDGIDLILAEWRRWDAERAARLRLLAGRGGRP